jgi:hypothetical protein
MNLLGLQRQFAMAVMARLAPAGGEARTFIKPNGRMTPLERLEIYRRSYWARVLDSLLDDFPGLCAVLGRRGFDRLSKAYLSELPSCSFTLRDLGSRLEAWLRDHPAFGGENLAVALDMVRLEWAHIEAFDGGTKKPLGPEDLLELGPEMRFGLQPHLRLLELQYPATISGFKRRHREDECARRCVEAARQNRRRSLWPSTGWNRQSSIAGLTPRSCAFSMRFATEARLEKRSP